ncbi:MAG: hypothetical protein RIS31_57 [Actinomycetota bacterium]
MIDLRIGLIDSNELVRSGRAMVINSQSEMRVIFEESDPLKAVTHAPDYLVDVIVVGPSQYQLRGARFVESLCQALSDAGNEGVVVAYGAFTTSKLRYEALSSGAQEYVGLDVPASELLRTVRLAVKSDFLVDPTELRMLGDAFGFLPSNAELEEKLSELSESQTKIIELFLNGAGDYSIGRQLEIPRSRVAGTIESVMRAGNFTSRNQLALSLLGGSK